MPALFSSSAVTTGARTLMSGRYLSASLLTPPPMMNRSGHSSESTLRRYFWIRLPYSFHDSFSSSRAEPDASRSASLPSISM